MPGQGWLVEEEVLAEGFSAVAVAAAQGGGQEIGPLGGDGGGSGVAKVQGWCWGVAAWTSAAPAGDDGSA